MRLNTRGEIQGPDAAARLARMGEARIPLLGSNRMWREGQSKRKRGNRKERVKMDR